MSELRSTLLILGVVFIAALAWWEQRRVRRAGHAGAVPRAAARAPYAEGLPQPRHEPSLTLPTVRAREPIIRDDLPVLQAAGDPPTADRAPPPALQFAGEAFAGSTPPPKREPRSGDAPAAPAVGPGNEGVPAGVPLECLPRLPAVTAPLVEWPPDERRRVLALRLVATQRDRFAGRSLRQALAAEGFVLGRFAIFHKPDDEQRAVLSAASLTTPGTFDEETMDSQHFGGLSLFAVLPGPKPPPETFDELVLTARSLNDRLQGVLQDEQGSPLTPARVALLRERLSAGTAA